MRPFVITLLRVLVAALVCALAISSVSAQRFRLPEGPGVPPRFPPPDFNDGGFTHCKIMYRSVRSEANGMGWSTDYPFAGINLLTRVKELTKTRVSVDERGDPNYWVVRLTDDALFSCPFTMATDVGTIEFSPEEAVRLRQYLLEGGFLWVDDFWGTPAWEQWSSEMKKVLPEYSIEAVPADHPIRRTMFELARIPQVSSINFWRRSGGMTSERGADSPSSDFRMIADADGRIMVLMTHNTDIGDSWEREGEDPEFFLEFSPDGYALGINVVLYALTH
ncbi:MAG TPA: DUF4159 domain-containing protein [Vicinamibacterales bacterium]|nr:DUF4159 domain-containing protein [Vicinamibacterales bacterium]